MPIITLTTDLGLKDYYVSSIKASILNQYPDATIVDISHDVPKFDIAQAAFVVKNAMKDFPPGTIHILGVKPEASAATPHVAMYINGQYFIGADNGIFSLIFDQDPDKVVELTINQDTDLLTFHLARGGTLEIIGGPKDAFIQRSLFRAVVNEGMIRGTIIYVDSYGNVVTNINEKLFREIGKGKSFTIYFRESRYKIHQIVKSYNHIEEGDSLALFGATGYLEIAINSGNASQLLGLNINETIRIEFEA